MTVKRRKKSDKKSGTDVVPVVIENGYNKMEVMGRVVERMIDGDSLRFICSNYYWDENLNKVKLPQLEWFPNKSTILRWLNDDEGLLATSIAHARELQADAMNDDITEIINQMIRGDLDSDKARVAIWGKQWQAAKLRPKKYGEKIEHKHTGKIVPTDVSKLLTLEEATAAHKRLLESLRTV